MDMLPVRETSEVLNISTSTVRRMVRDGRLEGEIKETVYGPTWFISCESINKHKVEDDPTTIYLPAEYEQKLERIMTLSGINNLGDVVEVAIELLYNYANYVAASTADDSLSPSSVR